MKKAILLILVVLLTGCSQKETAPACDGYLDFDGCVEPSFDICTHDCVESAEDNKYYSFKKAQSYSMLVGTYYSELEDLNRIANAAETIITKEEILNHEYKGQDTFFYNYLAEVNNDYFGMSTIIELCSDRNIINGCVLNLADNRTITGNFLYGSDTFEVTWASTIDNTEYNFNSTLLLRANTALDNYEFEFIKTETGNDFDILKNSYSFFYDGVMKVYSHTLDDKGEVVYLYYMYDTNTGNSVYYTDSSSELTLDYYIASQNKMYSIEKIYSIDLEVYSVTYYSNIQDYMSVRVIKKSNEFIAVQESYNLRYVDGWDTADRSKDELYLNNTKMNQSNYTLNSVTDNINGSSPFKLTKDYTYDGFVANGMFVSDDLVFPYVAFDTVLSDVDGIINNEQGFHITFGIDFNGSINQMIEDYVDAKQLENN